jgi:hypothetical protein
MYIYCDDEHALKIISSSLCFLFSHPKNGTSLSDLRRASSLRAFPQLGDCPLLGLRGTKGHFAEMYSV